MAEIFLCFSWALVISMFAIPSIIYVAESKKLLNHPNERTTHLVSVPRLGGLAIFAGFLSSVLIFGDVTREVQYLLAGCLIIFYIALKDDLVHVSAFKKFFVQILATGILVFLGDYRITTFHGLLGIHELELGTSYAFTMVVVLAITNSVNLIDGINGLAGTLVALILLIFSAVMYLFAPNIPLILLAVSLSGAVIGFLRYNFYEAKIFMGDTGSLICGFVISALLIELVEKVQVDNAPVLAMSLIFVPITDTVRITFLRLFEGKSPFMPDKNHIHHKMLGAGIPQVLIVLILATINVLSFVLFYFLGSIGNNYGLMIFFVLQLLTIFIVQMLKEKTLLA